MRQLPPFSAVVAFEAAARHESFLAASSELHLTPSAISHQVRKLEAWLGRRLFIRAARRLSLSDDGRRLLQELRPALDTIDGACAALRPHARRSQLSVHCAPSFASKWLGPRLAGFMKSQPLLTIRLSSGADAVNLLKDSSIDLHIAYGDAPTLKGVVVEALGIEQILPLCSPKLLPKGRPARAADLLKLTLIESQLSPVTWADWCSFNGLQWPRRDGPSFDRGALAVAAAVDGLGVALESTRFAQAELARGELVAVTGPGLRAVERPLHHLCHRPGHQDSPECAVFLTWLRQALSA